MAKRDIDHPWAEEAESLIPREETPEPPETPGVISLYHVAMRGVVVREDPRVRRLTATLATNPRLRDFTPDRDRGIAPIAIETPIAERALVARVRYELVKRDTLRGWIAREERARGGRGKLVDALAAALPPPPGRTPAHLRAGIMRAVQRVMPGHAGRAQSHSTIRSRDYWDRINAVRGGPAAAVSRMLALDPAQIGALGDWVQGQRRQEYVWHRTDTLPPPSENHAVLLGQPLPGDRFHQTIEEWLNDHIERRRGDSEPIELVWMYAIQVQIDLMTEG